MINYDGFKFPKPKKVHSKKTSKIKPGKKTVAWSLAREKLKKEFFKNGITKCELALRGCWHDRALSFAHVDKRRNLKEGELYEVVLACVPCHMKVEQMEHTEMRIRLEKIIKQRKGA